MSIFFFLNVYSFIVDTYSWYQLIDKPFFAPPAWVFGVVWSVLYPLIFVSFGYVFYLTARRRIPYKVAVPFVLNLTANLAFTPIQFGLQNFLLATVDITVVVLTLVWAMKAIHPYSKRTELIQIPYLIWIVFAAILEYSITILNFN